MLTMKMTFFYFLVLNQFLMSHFSQGSKLEKQCSTQENTREFLEEIITPLLTSRETVYVMGTLKHSFLSEIIQEWLVGLSLLLCQCLVSMYAKAMKVWEAQYATLSVSTSQTRTSSQLSLSKTLLTYVFISSFQTVMWVMQHISQTILKKTKTYSWLSLSPKCSKPKFTLTVIPKTDQQRHFFFLMTPSQ